MGKFPPSFKLWLLSAKTQPFDFVFITDQDQQKDCQGYKWHKITLEQLKFHISDLVGFPVRLSYPYKLCDYRPAYGEIFSDIIRDYQYWGYCDLDMIFGNTQFILDEVEQSYPDKIFQTGHLSFTKNTPDNNSLYKKSSFIDYKYIFSNNKTCQFDEWHGIGKIMKEYGKKVFHEAFYADIKPNSLYFAPENITSYKNQIFVYTNGNIIQYYLDNGFIKTRDLIYIHFQKRNIDFSALNNFCNSYIFTSKNIITITVSEISKSEIMKYNNLDYIHFIKRFWTRVKNKARLKKSIFDNYIKKINYLCLLHIGVSFSCFIT